mmetsp:Transcript_16546/g.25011  ORF Transcript_16546/g.25011 Transcript_16546/m.25011 type:complete len:539 (+) Transcript_16546:251-1867(+)|eukprot:scaffold363_cov139-Skeletonema_dohrnii-CCMP3373.AAC.4
MSRGMNTMPTIRRGRTYVQMGANDKRGISGFCSVIFIILLLIAPPIFLLASERSRHTRYITLSDALNSDVIELNQKSIDESDLHSIPPGTLVHGTSTHIETLASDHEMNIGIPGALTLHRNTEYCQWQEIQSQDCQTCKRTVKARDGSTKEESYQCNCITTYNYIKGWKFRRIDSLLFNQPGAHHNPQRDPMPSTTFVGQDVTLEFDGDVTTDDNDKPNSNPTSPSVSTKLDPTMLSNGVRNQPWRNVDFVPQGKAPPPSFFSRYFADRTRYEPLQLLKNTPTSPAAIEDNFVYVGQGGYFFSPYESSTASKLFNYFAQYLEGSLFDYQLGDLVGLASCTAGDIRFYYSVKDPNEISVLGQVREANGAVQITPRVLNGVGNEKDSSIGLVHSGKHSAQDMLLAEDSDSRFKATVMRAIFFLWSIAASRLVGVAVGREIGDSSLSVKIEAAISLFAVLIGWLWLSIWGASVHTYGLILTGLFLAHLSYNSAVKKGSGRWYIAVWSKIAQWANLAPEMRQEDSYVPSPKRIDVDERTKVS